MNTLLWNIGSGVLRHLLTYGSGVLVTGGYVSDNEGVQVVGAVMALVAIAWSAINKSHAETRVLEALATPVLELPILSPDDPNDNTPALNKAEVKRVGG